MTNETITPQDVLAIPAFEPASPRDILLRWCDTNGHDLEGILRCEECNGLDWWPYERADFMQDSKWLSAQQVSELAKLTSTTPELWVNLQKNRRLWLINQEAASILDEARKCDSSRITPLLLKEDSEQEGLVLEEDIQTLSQKLSAFVEDKEINFNIDSSVSPSSLRALKEVVSILNDKDKKTAYHFLTSLEKVGDDYISVYCLLLSRQPQYIYDRVIKKARMIHAKAEGCPSCKKI